MTRYRRKPLKSILKTPADQTRYLLIQNQYWAVDDEDNVFFIGLRPICGANKKTVHFYIERLELPLTVIYTDDHKRTYKLIKLKEAWVKKSVGYSRVRH